MSVDYIVVHCSDSPNWLDDKRLDGAGEIHDWHLQNGWDGIGYHYVINELGELETGRPVFEKTKTFWPGAHCRGYNGRSIGVCLIGKRDFHDSQLKTARALIEWLLVVWPEAKVVGHRDLDPAKTCPNFDAGEWFYGEKVAL